MAGSMALRFLQGAIVPTARSRKSY